MNNSTIVIMVGGVAVLAGYIYVKDKNAAAASTNTTGNNIAATAYSPPVIELANLSGGYDNSGGPNDTLTQSLSQFRIALDQFIAGNAATQTITPAATPVPVTTTTSATAGQSATSQGYVPLNNFALAQADNKAGVSVYYNAAKGSNSFVAAPWVPGQPLSGLTLYVKQG